MNNDTSIVTHGDFLVYRAGYTPSFVAETMRRLNLTGLRIFSQLPEQRLPDWDFLNEYSFLKELDITSRDDHEFSFLGSLPNLKRLSIGDEGRTVVDLSEMSGLEDLRLTWRKGKVFGLDKCVNISKISLEDYTEEDLLPIKPISSLTQLRVTRSTIRTVNGIEHFPKIHTLSLRGCRRLKAIGMMRALPTLKDLHLEAIPNLDDLSAISGMAHLENVMIVDCKRVRDIDQLTLPSIKLFYCNSRDMTSLVKR